MIKKTFLTPFTFTIQEYLFIYREIAPKPTLKPTYLAVKFQLHK